MKNLIENYNDAKQKIYDHVAFVEDWVIYPIDDRTKLNWLIEGDHVIYHENEITPELILSGEYYQDEIYTQRFYKKHIYRGKLFTMIFANTNVDGMKYFAIFDNKKEKK